MIKAFVEAWDKQRELAKATISSKHPDDYEALFRLMVSLISDAMGNHGRSTPDPSRITIIDHGSYQGAMVFVVGETGSPPNRYWGCIVDYGSCSGCDTFEAIRDYGHDAPTEEQVSGYMQLCLNMVQGLRPLHSGDE